jgi:hypothetical protein
MRSMYQTPNHTSRGSYDFTEEVGSESESESESESQSQSQSQSQTLFYCWRTSCVSEHTGKTAGHAERTPQVCQPMGSK